MTKEQIEKLQEYFKTYYPRLNNWWCWLFAYTFVSRVGGEWLRLSYMRSTWEQKVTNNWINKELSSHHFVVEYNWMIFDWHEFFDSKMDWFIVEQKVDKPFLAVAILEWWWNSTFFRENHYTNAGECMYDFIYNFEWELDKLWVDYSSRL